MSEIQHITSYIQTDSYTNPNIQKLPQSHGRQQAVRKYWANILNTQSRHLAAARQFEVENYLGYKHGRKDVGE
jgi:hypothetical protein